MEASTKGTSCCARDTPVAENFATNLLMLASSFSYVLRCVLLLCRVQQNGSSVGLYLGGVVDGTRVAVVVYPGAIAAMDVFAALVFVVQVVVVNLGRFEEPKQAQQLVSVPENEVESSCRKHGSSRNARPYGLDKLMSEYHTFK